MNDESHLPVTEQSLVFRLRKRAEIRRQIPTRKSVEEGKPDRMADLLDEAAIEIERLMKFSDALELTIMDQEDEIISLENEISSLHQERIELHKELDRK